MYNFKYYIHFLYTSESYDCKVKDLFKNSISIYSIIQNYSCSKFNIIEYKLTVRYLDNRSVRRNIYCEATDKCVDRLYIDGSRFIYMKPDLKYVFYV